MCISESISQYARICSVGNIQRSIEFAMIGINQSSMVDLHKSLRTNNSKFHQFSCMPNRNPMSRLPSLGSVKMQDRKNFKQFQNDAYEYTDLQLEVYDEVEIYSMQLTELIWTLMIQ